MWTDFAGNSWGYFALREKAMTRSLIDSLYSLGAPKDQSMETIAGQKLSITLKSMQKKGPI